MSVLIRQIRARYAADTVTVYQAYSPQIALPAVAARRFVTPFKRDRMTWTKPSFRWTVTIVDITPTVRRIRDLLTAGDHRAAAAHLPAENAYPLPEHLRERIGASLPG